MYDVPINLQNVLKETGKKELLFAIVVGIVYTIYLTTIPTIHLIPSAVQ